MSRTSPKRVIFTNQQRPNFPVEDLKFKNPEATDYEEFAETQRVWDMSRNNSSIGTVEIESSIEYAREAFHEKMEEFPDMDEDERVATIMEALLYRQMLRWNEDSKDPVLEGEKTEFMYNLNVFLRRRIGAAMRDEVLQKSEAEQSYVPDQLDLSLRQMVEENKDFVSSYGSWISITAQYLNNQFEQRNNPHWNRISGRVERPPANLVY